MAPRASRIGQIVVICSHVGSGHGSTGFQAALRDSVSVCCVVSVCVCLLSVCVL